MKTSKWFVVATEGATADGRTIERRWIEEMAANYDPSVYGARVNLEHFKGILPDGVFKRLGDVLALTTEERDGKLRLLAQIAPTDDLVAMVQAKQKIYTSIEVNPDFADLHSAYLVGLAVTDDPASLGTEMLAFSATAKQNPLAHRKQHPNNLFTAAIDTALCFEDGQTLATQGDIQGLFAKLKALFSHQNEAQSEARNEANAAEFGVVSDKTAENAVADDEPEQVFRQQVSEQLNQLSAAFAAFSEQVDLTKLAALYDEMEALKAQFAALSETPKQEFNLPEISGSENQIQLTDC